MSAKLFGVEHGSNLTMFGVEFGRYRVQPAKEMLDAIREAPEGSVVGLETFPEMIKKRTDLGFAAEDIHYWRQIVRACKESGKQIAYLDNAEMHRKLVKICLADQAIFDAEAASQGVQRQNEVGYSLQTQYDYTFDVEREDSMFRNIVQTRPDIVVIGQGHADRLMTMQEPVIDISEYFHVNCDHSRDADRDLMMMSDYGRQLSTEQELVTGVPDVAHSLARESLMRAYRSIKFGRIMATEATPDWIGSWDTSCRQRGLFEMFSVDEQEGTDEHRHQSGIIEDIIGTASYSAGTFNEDRVSFYKQYFPNRLLSNNAIMDGMNYEARRVDDNEYMGDVVVRGYAIASFVLKKGQSLFTPIDLDQYIQAATYQTK